LILIRSLIFMFVFYLWSAVLSVGSLPLMVCPRRWTLTVFRFWARGVFVQLSLICGIRVELRGGQHVPHGRAIVAPKHQCMFDVFAQFVFLEDSCFVMRKELMRIPFFGFYAWSARMIAVDREGGAAALRELLAQARRRLQEPRQLVIFPEGHRGEPGIAGDYFPGVAGLARDLGLPTHPVATNSGVHWPAHGIVRKPGTIVFEYLEPIPVGLKRAEYMRRLENQIETASNALLDL
jgi:1-acyl-sn-glycerol-3-phosphate acyltransferase